MAVIWSSNVRIYIVSNVFMDWYPWVLNCLSCGVCVFMSGKKKMVFVVLCVALLFSAFLISSYALFSGSHTVYTNRTNASQFCVKCHSATVSSVMVSGHGGVGCLCHGYNPNATSEYNLNLAHNLTKEIYCTNCHSTYDSAGNITIHTDPIISGINQSAHYITNNRSVLARNTEDFFS